MFKRILVWLRGVLNKMLNKTTIKNALQVDIAISKPMIDALSLWVKMYENDAPWLLNKDIKSLNLPAAIASEIAKSVTIEMEVKIEGSARADYLAEQFKWVQEKLREKCEFMLAKGGLVFKPYPEGDQILVDYIQADQFFPIEVDSRGNIVSCVFVDQCKIGDKYFTRLESHTMGDYSADTKEGAHRGCKIRNVAFSSRSKGALGQSTPLSSVPRWADLEPEATITNIDKPLFAYLKVPAANNIDSSSALGVSCYARAVNLIEDADVQWSNFLWEFESGQRALFVDQLAFGVDDEGDPVLPIKRLYRALDAGGQDDSLFKEWSPELREINILNGLNSILKRIEYACGMAYGTLSDPNIEAKTATEIQTSKQRTFAMITDTQKALQTAMEQLLWAMDTWATLSKVSAKGNYEVAFDFDDSIIVDKGMQFQQDLSLVDHNVMSRLEWRVRNFKESEEVAKKQLALIDAEQPEGFFEEGDK